MFKFHVCNHFLVIQWDRQVPPQVYGEVTSGVSEGVKADLAPHHIWCIWREFKVWKSSDSFLFTTRRTCRYQHFRPALQSSLALVDVTGFERRKQIQVIWLLVKINRNIMGHILKCAEQPVDKTTWFTSFSHVWVETRSWFSLHSHCQINNTRPCEHHVVSQNPSPPERTGGERGSKINYRWRDLSSQNFLPQINQFFGGLHEWLNTSTGQFLRPPLTSTVTTYTHSPFSIGYSAVSTGYASYLRLLSFEDTRRRKSLSAAFTSTQSFTVICLLSVTSCLNLLSRSPLWRILRFSGWWTSLHLHRSNMRHMGTWGNMRHIIQGNADPESQGHMYKNSSLSFAVQRSKGLNMLATWLKREVEQICVSFRNGLFGPMNHSK